MPDDHICPECGQDLSDQIRMLGDDAMRFHIWTHARDRLRRAHEAMLELDRQLFIGADGKPSTDKTIGSDEMMAVRRLVWNYFTTVDGRPEML